MTTEPLPTAKPRPWLLAGLVLGLIAAGFVAWLLLRPRPKPVDMSAAMTANNRGIGHMDCFEYDKAIVAFEEVVRNAPDWPVGQINLCLALLNQAGNSGGDGEANPSSPRERFNRAIGIYKEVLSQNPDALWQTYAHYGLGLIYITLGEYNSARPHLERSAELDPNDPHVLFRYGLTLNDSDPKLASDYFRRALHADPYLGAAAYAYFTNAHVRTSEPDRAKALSEEYERMAKPELFNATRDRYSEHGRYGEAIGRTESEAKQKVEPLPIFLPPAGFKVILAEGTRWTTAKELSSTDDIGKLRGLLRERFGGVMVLLDHDRDGLIDVFLVGAVVRYGVIGNLLLRNEGNVVFRDVTEKAGLDAPHRGVGACVADFDNDTYPDLFLTGMKEARLFRNKRDGSFEDVTKQAKLDGLKGVSLAAAFSDLDQDGDLDLIVSLAGDTPADAEAMLRSPEKKRTGRGLALYLNNGMAHPQLTGVEAPPLSPSFIPHEHEAFKIAPPVTGLCVGDFDGDQDPDVLVLSPLVSPRLILNDRLLRFTHRTLIESGDKGNFNGALILDANRDERSDLLVLDSRKQPSLLLLDKSPVTLRKDDLVKIGTIRSPRLSQAQSIDLDLDGWPDAVGLTADRLPVLLQNEAGRLVDHALALGGDITWPKDLLSVAAADMDGDGKPDLVAWSEKEGFLVHRQSQNDRQALLLELCGHRRVDVRGSIVRCNSDGLGTKIGAHVKNHWCGMEYGTLQAGLGQSKVPLLLGLGSNNQADVVRIRWPDNCWQGEFNLPAGKLHRIDETNRKDTSCPILFTWDGKRYVFVTDFLGAGTLGETLADGNYRKPRPEESVKIEAHQLAPRDGFYSLKVAEPMNEVAYLDRLQLLVLDHLADVAVYPDERMATADPAPTQDLFEYRGRIDPIRATNHRGKDVTAKLREADRDAVNEFAWRTWVGFAEDHWVELDFGDQLRNVKPEDRLAIFLQGWTEYAYPESIWAANQAGLKVQPPVLERKEADGSWKAVAEIGFPAGMPRTMTFDLTGKLAGNTAPLRIRTNLQVFWDQLVLARIDRIAPPSRPEKHSQFQATPLEVSSARLYHRGFMQEYSPDGKLPTIYDHDRLVSVPVTRLSGRLTRFGDVTSLLREADDCFVVIGPGDETEVRFDARELPALPAGWKRSYVLRTWGYCKDTAPFTATGQTVEPLPFRTMSNYPYKDNEAYPNTPKHRDYLRQFQTREVGSVGKRR